MIDWNIVFHMTESFSNQVIINIKYINSKSGIFIKYVPNLAIIKWPKITKFT